MEGEETQGEQGLYVPLANADEEDPATGARAWKARALWIGISYADSAPQWRLLGPAERRSPRTAGGILAPQSRAAIQASLKPLFSTGRHHKGQ
jgi:hypothetical protein